MYKVFFNDNVVYITGKNPGDENSLTAGYRNKEELKNLVNEIIARKVPRKLYIVHPDTEVLRNDFCNCFECITAGGGLVKNAKSKVLFIRRWNKWDLPKGKVEGNESSAQTAVREVSEECGLKGLQIIKNLPATYHTYERYNKPILKRTDWFEMYYSGNEVPVPQKAEKITEAVWFDKREIHLVKEETYLSILDVLGNAGFL
ncbi:MAG: NUDIX domain-containing protein [Bacteroidetes bacterium]|nr:NUDIX domain-containing protein [Bacteroidota bacterium]